MEVLRVYAVSGSASVVDDHPFGDLAVLHEPANAVSATVEATEEKRAVAVTVERSFPEPTAGRRLDGFGFEAG